MALLKKLKVMAKSLRVRVVSARPDMAEAIAAVELEAWGHPRYIPAVSVYEDRIRSFSQGVLVALYRGEVAGVAMYMLVPSVEWVMGQENFHAIVAHFGKLRGDTGFGVTWSVPTRGSVVGATAALEAEMHTRCFLQDNLKAIVLGARPLHFCDLNRARGERGFDPLSIEEYVDLTRGEFTSMFGKEPLAGNRRGKRYDSELALYLDLLGFKVVGFKKDYMPEDSPVNEGWGVIIARNNPFHRWPQPARKLLAVVAPVLSRVLV